MSNYFTFGAIALVAVVVGAAFWQGYNYGGKVKELENARADQAQLEDRRETNAAVNRLDDTGLRDTILHNGKNK